MRSRPIPHWRLDRLARELDVYEREPVVYVGRRGRIEHLIHEVGHAVSLDISLAPGMDKAIERKLKAGTPRDAEENEALVLAAERFILRALDVAHHDLEAVLGDAADIQRVSAGVFEAAFASPAAVALANRVIAALKERTAQ